MVTGFNNDYCASSNKELKQATNIYTGTKINNGQLFKHSKIIPRKTSKKIPLKLKNLKFINKQVHWTNWKVRKISDVSKISPIQVCQSPYYQHSLKKCVWQGLRKYKQKYKKTKRDYDVKCEIACVVVVFCCFFVFEIVLFFLVFGIVLVLFFVCVIYFCDCFVVVFCF